MGKILLNINSEDFLEQGYKLAGELSAVFNIDSEPVMITNHLNGETNDIRKELNTDKQDIFQKGVENVKDFFNGSLNEVEEYDHIKGLNKDDFELIVTTIKENKESDHFISKLKEKVDCPVFSIIHSQKKVVPENIGVLINGDGNFDEEGLKLICKLAKAFQAKVHLMAVVPENGENDTIIRHMQELGKQYNLSPFTVSTVINDDIQDGLDLFSGKKNLDIISVFNSYVDINIDELVNVIKWPVVLLF